MFRRIALVSLLAVSALGATSGTVAAKSTAIVPSGSCSGATDWKLKISPDNGRIQVEFEVDQNRNNRLWKVVMAQNGKVVLRTSRYTRAPSGSFEVRRVLANRAGKDRIVARATNVRTGEVCRRHRHRHVLADRQRPPAAPRGRPAAIARSASVPRRGTVSSQQEVDRRVVPWSRVNASEPGVRRTARQARRSWPPSA